VVRGGMGSHSQALAQAARELRVAIRTGVGVREIRVEEDGPRRGRGSARRPAAAAEDGYEPGREIADRATRSAGGPDARRDDEP
jgi:phytoene dehydrogenase-like protein